MLDLVKICWGALFSPLDAQVSVLIHHAKIRAGELLVEE